MAAEVGEGGFCGAGVVEDGIGDVIMEEVLEVIEGTCSGEQESSGGRPGEGGIYVKREE